MRDLNKFWKTEWSGLAKKHKNLQPRKVSTEAAKMWEAFSPSSLDSAATSVSRMLKIEGFHVHQTAVPLDPTQKPWAAGFDPKIER